VGRPRLKAIEVIGNSGLASAGLCNELALLTAKIERIRLERLPLSSQSGSIPDLSQALSLWAEHRPDREASHATGVDEPIGAKVQR
jgi:hypothetical protein